MKKPIAAFITMTTTIANASTHSPKTNDTIAAAVRRSTIRLLSWLRRITKALFPLASLRRFGPYFLNLFLTSDVLSPLCGSTSKSLRTSSLSWLK
jgi:hypothetical protein